MAIMWNTISCNAVYQRFLRQREDAAHLHRLQSIRARLDTAKPKTSSLNLRRGKSQRLKDDREIEIRRENGALLRRMLTIDLKPTKNRIGKSGSVTTLNKVARERFLQEINASNRGLFTRIRDVESVYSIAKWEKSRQWNEYLVQNLSKNAGRLDYSMPRSASSRPNTVGESRLKLVSTRQSARPRTEEHTLQPRVNAGPL